jgi:hypothetical protein
MWKIVLAGTTALVIAGGSFAVAQSGPSGDGPRAQAGAAETGARVDARLARIKSRLRLTAEQEKHWPAVEAAIRDLAKERVARISERRASREDRAQADMVERMRRGADAMSTRSASLKKLADAVEPLYKSLDDTQKRQLGRLLRAGESRAQRFSEARRFDHRGGHRGHHGPYRGRDAR